MWLRIVKLYVHIKYGDIKVFLLQHTCLKCMYQRDFARRISEDLNQKKKKLCHRYLLLQPSSLSELEGFLFIDWIMQPPNRKDIFFSSVNNHTLAESCRLFCHSTVTVPPYQGNFLEAARNF